MSAIHHLTGFFNSMYDEFKRSYEHYPVLSYYSLRTWSRGGRLLRYLSVEQWALIVDVMKSSKSNSHVDLDSWPNKIVGYLYTVLPHPCFEQVKLLLCPTVRGQATTCHTWAVDTGCLYCHMDVMDMEPADLEAQVAKALMARWENTRAGPRYDLKMQNSSLYRRRLGLDLGAILC